MRVPGHNARAMRQYRSTQVQKDRSFIENVARAVDQDFRDAGYDEDEQRAIEMGLIGGEN